VKYKLFLSDYDGTLGVAPKNDIDKETLSAIKKYNEQGGIFAICSGRETSSIMRILKAHGLDGVVASFQGARISEIGSGKVIFKGGLDAKTALEALDAVEGVGLPPLLTEIANFSFKRETLTLSSMKTP
jgi:HAD superfamily hydrolase (TIGR01484 family)